MRLAQEERIARLEAYRNGATDDELMDKFNLSRSAVHAWRYKEGFTHANKHRMTLDEAIEKADGQMLEWLTELKRRQTE